ncbi:MAG TPA: hypothetical protein VEQ66_12070 [Propionibacteriaceae bacterium]|nr:hypothetical protein [Propionibacteriaceae bacterium]
MSIFDRKPALRWLTPLAFVAVVGGSTGIYATATAGQPLPELTAEQLLVKLQEAKVDALWGTVVQNADLGLPALPGMGGSDDASLTSLLTGSHQLNVWYSGPDKARLRINSEFGESDVIRNGKDLWHWSYEDKSVTHRTLTHDESAKAGSKAGKLPADLPSTPQEAAKQALGAIDSTTKVSTDPTATVAKRSAYELVLAPQDKGSKISQVKIAVDGETFIPLRVQVIAGDRSAFDVAYSSVNFSRPDDSQFTFTAPPGTKVTEVKPDESAKARAKAHREQDSKARTEADEPKVYGKGWSSVVVSEMGTRADAQGNDQLDQVLESLPRTPDKKGRVLNGTAFAAVITDDGRLAVGAVEPELLYEALTK